MAWLRGWMRFFIRQGKERMHPNTTSRIQGTPASHRELAQRKLWSYSRSPIRVAKKTRVRPSPVVVS